MKTSQLIFFTTIVLVGGAKGLEAMDPADSAGATINATSGSVSGNGISSLGQNPTGASVSGSEIEAETPLAKAFREREERLTRQRLSQIGQKEQQKQPSGPAAQAQALSVAPVTGANPSLGQNSGNASSSSPKRAPVPLPKPKSETSGAAVRPQAVSLAPVTAAGPSGQSSANAPGASPKRAPVPLPKPKSGTSGAAVRPQAVSMAPVTAAGPSLGQSSANASGASPKSPPAILPKPKSGTSVAAVQPQAVSVAPVIDKEKLKAEVSKMGNLTKEQKDEMEEAIEKGYVKNFREASWVSGLLSDGYEGELNMIPELYDHFSQAPYPIFYPTASQIVGMLSVELSIVQGKEQGILPVSQDYEKDYGCLARGILKMNPHLGRDMVEEHERGNGSLKNITTLHAIPDVVQVLSQKRILTLEERNKQMEENSANAKKIKDDYAEHIVYGAELLGLVDPTGLTADQISGGHMRTQRAAEIEERLEELALEAESSGDHVAARKYRALKPGVHKWSALCKK